MYNQKKQIMYTDNQEKELMDIEKNQYYSGEDLGCTYTKEKARFRIWAPTAELVQINLYREGSKDNLIKSIPMTKDQEGTWVIEVKEDLVGVYYTYLITINGEMKEAVDPYARTTGVNGHRAMVIDLKSTNPEGWYEDEKPVFEQVTDAVIYELHVRDISSDPNSNINNVGKFLGLTETGTKSEEGLSTGLDHIKELGITHLHLLPIYDYATVDEDNLSKKQFNWGYDPQNYNVPEGSYATNPYSGEVRVKELKKMIQILHENHIRVVMDVVYNHTFETEDSDFNKIVPHYFYRRQDGIYTDGSGCGNEIASERKMVRKYIVDSVIYWAKEYHIDGFRFDLMGVLDCDTMNEIRLAVDKIDPSILLYGEGWNGGESALNEEERAIIDNASKVPSIAMFNDRIRDNIKGSVFNDNDSGYVNGAEHLEESIKCGVVGSITHPQVKCDDAWTMNPTQSINYVSAHDNYTLWDKLALTCPDDSIEDRIRRNKLVAAIVFTSQGIPFFQAGEEILRSKVREDGTFDDNSYISSDSINSIKWINKQKYIEVFEYYKGLISFRKMHKALRMTTANEVREKIAFMNEDTKNVIQFIINSSDNNQDSLLVIYNANEEPVTMNIPNGSWNLYVNDQVAGNECIETITSGKVVVNKLSAMVLVKE
ncbi:type I pullulanase [Anaeromicropila herbilytica]|uniref:Glycosyl hydrolase family 13 catalytic domain-containing protein n=1 Tax=Anaeromicropila herbilytica TaxID=2785025 RepID=A0A7R7IC11_9FIRM|nr:type I pullulanase [Anaeromicropila herbilytica]BCN30228.1 hypothetical protein bsdtb5_15230 [Anaeromicropila herbilytica]